MDAANMRIINETVSRKVYFLRRAGYLDRVVPPGRLQQAHASMHAAKVYAGVSGRLTISKMNGLETAVQVQTTSAFDFRGGFTSGGHGYSQDEYQETRARSLQQGVNSEQVVRDADAVFRGDSQLLALEILYRELATGAAPLLPLPTTSNLQTVDDSLGDGDDLPLSVLSTFLLSEEQRQQVLPGAPPGIDSRAPSFSPVTSPSSAASPSPERVQSPAPAISSPGPQRTAKGRKSRGNVRSTNPYPTRAPARETRASRYNKSEQDKVVEMEENLGQVMLAGASTRKIRTSRRILSEKEEEDEELKEEQEEEHEVEEYEEDDGEEEKEEDEDEQEEEEKEEVVDALPPIPRKIRDILVGNVLPANAKQAEQAATERRECLLRHKMAISGRKITARGLSMTAVPPEFAASNRKSNTIACVCGNKDENDVEGEWVACDQCNVWQHVACMEDGVPKDKEGDEYLCQQCDPFTHRKLIRRLRREQPLPDDVVPKGV